MRRRVLEPVDDDIPDPGIDFEGSLTPISAQSASVRMINPLVWMGLARRRAQRDDAPVALVVCPHEVADPLGRKIAQVARKQRGVERERQPQPVGKPHAIRRACDHHDIRLGLHTLSAVNVAEFAPLIVDAVDAYLTAYIDAAVLLGAEWIVVHAGFHFSADIPQRMQAGLDRLRRAADYAAHKSVLLLLENLNKEPS